MDIEHLDDEEQLALIVLAKAMVHADGHVTNDEMLDLVSLGEAMGLERFNRVLDAAQPHLQTWEAVFAMADRVWRHDARVLIFMLLEELARGDGFEGLEMDVLNELRMRWRVG